MSNNQYYGGNGNYSMPQAPQYAQGAPPPPQGQPGAYNQQANYAPPNSGGYESYQKPNSPYNMPLAPDGFQGERFKPARPKIRDPIFLILFLAVFGGFTGLSVYVLREYSISDVSGGIGDATGLGGTLNQNTAILLTLSCAVALVFSALYLALVRAATRAILEITLALSVIFNIGYCVYLWIEGNTSAAIIFTIFAVLSIVSYFFMRSRIPLTRLLLKTAIDATKTHPSVYLWALIGLLVQTLFSIWTAWTLVAVYQRFSPSGAAAGRGGNTGSGAVTGLVVFVVFAFYWISETLKAIFFATNCGVFGAWYYAPPGQKKQPVSLSSFGRATSFSLGSLAFGSLIVAILDIIRGIVSLIQSTEASEGDMVGYAISCVAGCIISCIAWLIEFFNKYAIVNVSLYGNSYIHAAKETWRLMKDRGIDALAQDSLVNIVWSFGSIVVGVITGLFAFIYTKQTNPQYAQSESSYISVILFYAIGLGIQICLTLGEGSVGAGTATLFVAIAEDPQVLAQKEPELFDLLRQAYPRVVQAVA